MTPTGHPEAPRLLITAGPTHEPIDAVRFIGNRSSGRLGLALADEAAGRGWAVTLLLGPTHLAPSRAEVHLERYRTTSDLGALLARVQAECDVLVMAAAVADYRPRVDPEQLHTKLKRRAGAMVVELEPTEDLLAACSARRRPGQLLVGFALEPRDRLIASATEKLRRKAIDLIVANPLETMESPQIEATVLSREGILRTTDGPMPKEAFAPWLLDLIGAAWGPMAGKPA